MLYYSNYLFYQFDQCEDLKILTMPGFDKVGAYETIDSTDKEDELNSQCQSQLDNTDNVKGKFV